MDKATIASAIWTRLFELDDTVLTDQELSEELAEAVLAAIKRETPEIPAAMLTAATECILTRGGYNRYDYPDVYSPEHSRYIAATKEAAAILGATGVAELLTRIAELEAEIVKVRESAHENFTYLENLAEQKRTEAR